MSSELRQRRPYVEPESECVEEEEEGEKGEKGEAGGGGGARKSAGPGWVGAFVFLMIARYYSASYNIIHDCDEVFNYWEPLHYLLYKSGFQTWEYSSEFALRSYLYLLLHAAVGGPSFWFYGAGFSKVQVFFTLRLSLGFLSAVTEATLVAVVTRRYGARMGMYTLGILCISSGCFNASTSLLPSSFSMYAITLAAALVLSGRRQHRATVAVAAFGVLVGWPFAAMAAAPLVVYSLATGGFLQVFCSGLITTICTMVLSVLTDCFFYGRWTSSVLNLVFYNVFSEEGSTLYGVEGPLFYFKNAFNNFNFAFPFALLCPLVLLLSSKRKYCKLVLAVSPIFVWLAFMSLQPHKEERFLYPVYPLICLAAASTLDNLHNIFPEWWKSHDILSFFTEAVKKIRPLILGVILALSYSRTLSLWYGYYAPMQVYQHLPVINDTSPSTTTRTVSTICVGNEWYQYPSSFFLSSSNYQVGWLQDGFEGALPLPFVQAEGGTRSAPKYFNNKNKASPHQYVADEGICDFLVELELDRRGHIYRSLDKETWEVIYAQRYLDKERSPAKYRAFFLPWAWEKSNQFGTYRLLKRIRKASVHSH
ncbi:unnamed protein product [Sphagnum jensenii]|uniref:Mannosyltransferase n=1 Tax=Sphagnum jensenii TaxID=128206 RepID=A0ABP1BK45_9BRYO